MATESQLAIQDGANGAVTDLIFAAAVFENQALGEGEIGREIESKYLSALVVGSPASSAAPPTLPSQTAKTTSTNLDLLTLRLEPESLASPIGNGGVGCVCYHFYLSCYIEPEGPWQQSRCCQNSTGVTFTNHPYLVPDRDICHSRAP